MKNIISRHSSISKCAALVLAFAVLLSLALPGAALKADAAADSTLIAYEGPKTMTSSADAKVIANGQELFVYDVMVNHQHIWSDNVQPSRTPVTYFDFTGSVSLEMTMPGLSKPVESAVVMPASYGIIPEVKDGTVSFSITEPGQYTVVFNDNVNKALHIFANPPETDIPDPNDPDVYFIGPGEWTIDAIALKDNQTLYISGGAVLHTIVSVPNADNVRICGRGMIDGSDYSAWNQPGSYARVPIDINHSKNVTAEGIIIVNSNCWNFNSYSSKNVTIDNVKIISGRQNGDGFTFQSCINHTVTNSFVRSWDDSLVVKNYSGSSDGITFSNIQIWTDLAQSMEIGYETDKGYTLDPEISNVLFEDITVLYNFHKPVISIHNSDDAYVHDITYRNIVVENAFMEGDNGNNNELIEMHLKKSGWSTVKDEYGSVDNILIDGLTVVNTVEGKMPRSRIEGHSEDNMVSNVTLHNVNILGQAITSLDQMKASVNEYCENINVVYDEDYEISAQPEASAVHAGECDVIIVATPDQTKAERPACFPNPEDNYIPMPETENYAVGKPVSSGAHTDVYVDKNVNDGKTDTYWESKGFPAELTVDLQGTFSITTAAVRLNPSSIWEARIQELAILVSTDGEEFTEISPATKYEFNPDTGNRIRIDFDAVDASYVRFVFTMNSSSRTGGAQAAEVEVY